MVPGSIAAWLNPHLGHFRDVACEPTWHHGHQHLMEKHSVRRTPHHRQQGPCMLSEQVDKHRTRNWSVLWTEHEGEASPQTDFSAGIWPVLQGQASPEQGADPGQHEQQAAPNCTQENGSEPWASGTAPWSVLPSLVTYQVTSLFWLCLKCPQLASQLFTCKVKVGRLLASSAPLVASGILLFQWLLRFFLTTASLWIPSLLSTIPMLSFSTGGALQDFQSFI